MSKTTNLDKINHTKANEPAKTEAATCSTKGYKSFDCSVCGAKDIVVEEIDATNAHTYSEGWTYNETKHWHQCTECGAKSGEAEHKYSGYVSVSNAEHKGVCDCGSTHQAAHGTLTDVKDTAITATCAKDGKAADQKCSDCNYVKTGATISKDTVAHTFKPESKTGICEVCKTAKCDHKGNGEGAETCKTCGVSLKTEEACKHDGEKTYTALADNKHKVTCKACGEVITASESCTMEDVDNTAKTATCKEDGKEADKQCKYCTNETTGATISKDTVEHTYPTTGTTDKCDVCGTVKKDHVHSFDGGAQFGTCQTCGAIVPDPDAESGG